MVKQKMPSSKEPDSSVRRREKGKPSALKHAETISEPKKKTCWVRAQNVNKLGIKY